MTTLVYHEETFLSARADIPSEHKNVEGESVAAVV